MASKMAHDSARSLKMSSIMPPRGPKRVTRRFQELSETLQDPSKSPKSFKNLKKIMILTFSPFLFRCASEASR